jgi:hypothetical protein
MRSSEAVPALCCLALIGAILSPGALAGTWDSKSVVTFSSPVEIPGVNLAGWGVLPAGVYVFKFLESHSDRHIVQIFNREETIVYATILAIPNQRLVASDGAEIHLWERTGGQPPALRAWFHPGNGWGEEFVYPRDKAFALAKATLSPVLYTPADLPAEVTEPVVPLYAPVVGELRNAPVRAVTPAGGDRRLAETVIPPLAAERHLAASPAMRVTENSLAASTIPLPTMGLIGLLAIGGILILRSSPKGTR